MAATTLSMFSRYLLLFVLLPSVHSLQAGIEEDCTRDKVVPWSCLSHKTFHNVSSANDCLAKCKEDDICVQWSYKGCSAGNCAHLFHRQFKSCRLFTTVLRAEDKNPKIEGSAFGKRNCNVLTLQPIALRLYKPNTAFSITTKPLSTKHLDPAPSTNVFNTRKQQMNKTRHYSTNNKTMEGSNTTISSPYIQQKETHFKNRYLPDLIKAMPQTATITASAYNVGITEPMKTKSTIQIITINNTTLETKFIKNGPLKTSTSNSNSNSLKSTGAVTNNYMTEIPTNKISNSTQQILPHKNMSKENSSSNTKTLTTYTMTKLSNKMNLTKRSELPRKFIRGSFVKDIWVPSRWITINRRGNVNENVDDTEHNTRQKEHTNMFINTVFLTKTTEMNAGDIIQLPCETETARFE